MSSADKSLVDSTAVVRSRLHRPELQKDAIVQQRDADSSFGLRDDQKEQVREATDIADLVGSYVSLRRQGRNLVGLCPWHEDARPSLQVNPQRQTFRCWVCNIGGDVFSFLMRMERLEFPEALEQLAARAGIELRARRGGEASIRSRMQQTLAFAAECYRRCLESSPEAAEAREYLSGRDLTPHTIQAAGLGFAPQRWDWLISQAAVAGISPQDLLQAGLAVERSDARGHYDRFRGRVIFPIRDVMGRCIAFGGRVLPSAGRDSQRDPPAKYINSPETPLFSKSSTLYGLEVARQAIADSRRAIVVEGYTDCLAAWQAGVNETVAVLGTALGPRHAQLLRRYADRVIVVLDGDAAGRRRANEVLDLLLAEPIDLRIARLPSGMDPCDLLTDAGGDTFREVVDAAVDPLDYRLDETVEQLPSDASDVACLAAVESVLSAVARASSAVRRHGGDPSQFRLREDQVVARLERRFGLDRGVLRARIRDLAEPARSGPAGQSAAASRQPARRHQLPPWDREVLEVLVSVPEGAGLVIREVPSDDLVSPFGKAVLKAARRLFDECGHVELVRLFDLLPDPEMQSLLVEVDESAASRRGITPPERLKQLQEALKLRSVRRQTERTSRILKTQSLDADAEAALLEQIVAQRRLAQGMSDPKEG
jgi:DNA primase